MSDSLKRVMYISRARHKMTHGELSDLLAGARLRNRQHDITGLLAYDSGYFAQVLEGPEDAIDQLLRNITEDPRHDEYVLVSEGLVDQRYFEGWAMDWANLERMNDTRHSKLRGFFQQRNITDRDAVYAAMITFVDEHRRQR